MWYSHKEMMRRDAAFKARTHNLNDKDRKKALEEDMEEGWKEIQDCVLAFKAGKNILTGGRFDTLSLGTWIEIVKAARVPLVSAHIVALVEDIQTAMSGNPVPLNISKDMLNYYGMVRLDSCGSNFIKAQMSYRGQKDMDHNVIGATYDKSTKQYTFAFDERTINGIMTYVGQIDPSGNTPQPIWWRPWVQAIVIPVAREKSMGRGLDAWPLEWRVTVQNNNVVAISAYYIQAPIDVIVEKHLDADKPWITYDTIQNHLPLILRYSQEICKTLKERNIQPWHPRYIGSNTENDISFVMDFISTPSGPLFLEAGPRVPVDDSNRVVVEWGAHPCFFEHSLVGGIALSYDYIVPLSKYQR